MRRYKKSPCNLIISRKKTDRFDIIRNIYTKAKNGNDENLLYPYLVDLTKSFFFFYNDNSLTHISV